jgi:hypothetical protein
MTLAELQRSLVASGLGAAPAPPGVDERQVARARHALRAKRRRAAEAALPTLRRALGAAWSPRFDRHARAYTPAGLLYHVDDAWAFAASVRDDGVPALRAAARVELVQLGLRYVRDPRRDADRVRERRGLGLAVWPGRPAILLLRLPGRALRVWRLPLGRSG